MSNDVPVPPEVIELMPKIGTDAFAVWVYLKQNATDEGYIDASYDVIGEGVGMTGRTRLSNALKMLVAFDLLKKRKNFNAPVSYQVVTPSSPILGLLVPVVPKQDTNTTTLLINESIKREEELVSQNRTTVTSSPEMGRMGVAVSAFQRMNDAQQAEYMFQQVTGFMTIPARNRTLDIENIGKMLKEYGADETVRRMTDAFTAWKKKRTKDGRYYSKLNTGWIEWAVTGEIPGETDEPADPMAAIYAMYPKFSASDPR